MSAYAMDNGRDRGFQRAFKKAVIISLAFHCAIFLAMAVSAMFGKETETMPRTMPVSLMNAAPGPPSSQSAALAPSKPTQKEEKKTVPTPPPKKPEPKPEPEPETEKIKKTDPPPKPEKTEKKKEPEKEPAKKPEKKTISPKKEEVVKKEDKQEKKEEKKKEEVRKGPEPESEKASAPEPPKAPAEKDKEIAKSDAPSTLASNPDIEAARRLQGPPGVEGGTSSRSQWNSAMEVIEKDPRMKMYQGTVGTYIRDYWILPPSVPEGQGLRVDVMIKVDQNGNILDYEIVHESGHADFDQSVKDLLKNIERIPSVPVQVPGGELELPLRFIPEGYDY